MKFFTDRLASRVSLRTLFWRDMIAVGTTMSLACLAVALFLAAAEAPIWLVVLVFLLPLPYNAFMWHCVWTGAEAVDGTARIVVRATATVWLIIVLFI